MGLLAAYQALGGQGYLDAVKNFLIGFASMQKSAPGDPFTDGAWNIGYQVNPSGPPTYIPAIAPYDAQGISEIRWVDAVQCLPAFILWWYWKLSGDNATKNVLLPAFTKAIDGFIANNCDGATGFFFSSWQNKTAPTIFIYHDAVRRYSAGGSLIEQHNDAESFFTYSGNWGSYAPQGAIGSDEHFTLNSGDCVQFSLSLTADDALKSLHQHLRFRLHGPSGGHEPVDGTIEVQQIEGHSMKEQQPLFGKHSLRNLCRCVVIQIHNRLAEVVRKMMSEGLAAVE